jgi:hypothetical protein
MLKPTTLTFTDPDVGILILFTPQRSRSSCGSTRIRMFIVEKADFDVADIEFNSFLETLRVNGERGGAN